MLLKIVCWSYSVHMVCMNCSCIMCYFVSIFHVLTHFRATTLMLQTFQTMIKEFLGRGSILSDAVGVDGRWRECYLDQSAPKPSLSRTKFEQLYIGNFLLLISTFVTCSEPQMMTLHQVVHQGE